MECKKSITHTPGIRVHKLMKEFKPLSFQEPIFDALQTGDLKFPELLLWNDEGLQFFDKFAQTPTYYLNSKEIEILNRNADEIAACLLPNSSLIELGCGSLRKTGIILEALERQRRKVSYFALDVSHGELAENMELLATKFGNSKYISLHGLWGTYEDCVTWLAGGLELDTPERVTFLWMGNSVANLHHSEARSLLSRFSNACDTSGIEFQFIASIDACEREAKILTAYDESSEHLRNFIMNGLTTANTIFGREVFRCEDWTFTTEFDANQHELQVSYVPRCDAKVEIEGKCFIVQEGRKIRAITSGKWPERAVRLISKDIELSVSNVWRDEDAEYCFYLLRPEKSSEILPTRQCWHPKGMTAPELVSHVSQGSIHVRELEGGQ